MLWRKKLLTGEEGKRHHVLIKDFNTFMCDHTLHRRRKHFCSSYLQAFSSEEILKRHIEDWLKINDKQRIIMPKKGKYVKFRNYEREIKSPVIIYAGFESILVSENSGKEITKHSYTNKYQKHVACSYGYKIVYVDDNFSEPFKIYLGKYVVYKFINNTIGESKLLQRCDKKTF